MEFRLEIVVRVLADDDLAMPVRVDVVRRHDTLASIEQNGQRRRAAGRIRWIEGELVETPERVHGAGTAGGHEVEDPGCLLVGGAIFDPNEAKGARVLCGVLEIHVSAARV